MNKDQRKICAEIWTKNESELRKICRFRMAGRSEADMEDVMADLGLALINQIENHGVPEKPEAWLAVTLRNITNSYFREMYRRKDLTERFANKELVKYLEDPVEKLERQIAAKQEVEKLRSNLKDHENSLIDDVYFKEYKMKEIAEKKASTEKAVKQKHYRTIDKLRKVAKKI